MSWIDRLATFGAAATGIVGLVGAIAASRIERGNERPHSAFLSMIAGLIATVTRRRKP
ncbi:hypothetical protein ACIG54_10645 [Streptomyces achromogenes]|uniref:hypothetical protein n=1 Tax=Streptomyces achromogenes TaxID=67255 RepID=UPI0012FF05B4|nr:hypothetical protein [Streptomyces achromogenes]